MLMLFLAGPELYTETHKVEFATEGFDGVGISKQWPFIQIKTAPKIYALRRKASEKE